MKTEIRQSGSGCANKTSLLLSSAALAVPTALSMMIQYQCPAYARGEDHQQLVMREARQARHIQVQERRENRVSARELRQQSIDPSRQLRLTNMVSPAIRDLGINRSVRFDLDSRRDVFTLSQNDLQGASSVQVVLGGETTEFQAGDRVSAAEFAAIRGGSASSLVLDSNGRAEGGSFSLNSLGDSFTNLNVSKVVIPTNVTAFGDFSSDSNIQLHGDLVNNGTVVTYSTNTSNQAGTLSASDIINRHGASIATADAQSIAGANNNFALTLNSANGITNEGNIKASGSLNLVAGSGVINNTGTISSSTGDINISSAVPTTAIVVNAPGGVFDAANGAINIRTAQDLNGGDVSMFGGDYLSNQLNIYALQGNAFGNVGKVTGDLHTEAVTQHFYAATDTLTLSGNCITGDPTFVNTGGDIFISGDNSFNEAVAIIASGDIVAQNRGTISSNGGNILMIAGAKVTTTGSQTGDIPGTKATADVVVNFDPAVLAGGDIDFTDGGVFSIDSSSTTKAGNVTLAALAGPAGGGTVKMGGHLINALVLGSGTGTGGNVMVLAGANPSGGNASTIEVGNIRTAGGTGAKGGSVTLLTQQARSTAQNNMLTVGTNGEIKSGGVIGTGVLQQNAQIVLNGEITSVGLGGRAGTSQSGTSGGNIDIEAGSDLILNGNLQAYGTGGTGGGDGGDGADITLASVNGNIKVGTIGAAGGGGGGAISSTRPGGAGGEGGEVAISAANGTIQVDAIFLGNGGNGGAFNNGLGGGGGGSFGGGGGAGQYAGGGGGYFGGGGGSVGNGAGGDFSGGTGGAGGGNAPQASGGNGGVGGNGATGNGYRGGNGGLLGKGGLGASSSSGLAGADAPFAGTVSIKSKGNVTINGGVQGFKNLMLTTTDGNFAGGLLNGKNLNFQSQTGSFGTSAAKVPTNISTLTVKTNPGGTATTGFFASNGAQSTGISNVALAGRTFDFSSQGAITTLPNGSITAETTSLATSNPNSGFDINVQTVTKKLTVSAVGGNAATVVNTGDVFLQNSTGNVGFNLTAIAPNASSSAVIHLQGGIFSLAGVTLKVDGPTGSTLGIVEESTQLITGTGLNLIGTAKGDFGSNANPLLTQVGQFSASSFGSVYVKNTGSVQINPTTVGDTSNANSEFVFTTIPNPSQIGRITLGNGAGGGVTVRGANSKLTLQSSGNPGTAGIVWNGTANNLLVAANISLSDGIGGAGNDFIGTATKPILTQASKSLAVNTQRDAYIFNTGNVTILDSKLSAPSIFLLKNTGTVTASGKITAGNLIISSTGDIGTAANPLAVDGGNLSASSSAGSVFITNANTGTINLLEQTSNNNVYKNGALNTYSVAAPNAGLLTNSAAIAAKDIAFSSKAVATSADLTGVKTVSLTATAGDVSVGQDLVTAAATIAVSGNSNIVQSGTGIINAGSLHLSLGGGVANLVAANNQVKALTDTVTGTGQVLIKTLANCEIGAISGDAQTLTVNYSGTLSTKAGADFSVGPLTFTPNVPTADNSILIQNKITTGNTLTTLTASGKGTLTISATGALLGVGPKNLTTGTGAMSIGGALQSNQILLTTNGGSISQTAAGVITVPGEVNLVMNNGGTAALDTANNVFTTFKDSITGAGDVRVKVAGDLVLFQVNGADQKLTVNAAGNIIGPSVGNSVNAKTINLTSGGAGGIASGGQRLVTTATNVTLNATNASGNVFVTASNTGVVTLNKSTAGNIFDLDTEGSISIAGNIGTATTNQVLLTANHAGNIAEVSTRAGAVFGQSATLASSGGSISGSTTLDGLDTSVGTLTVTTNGSGIVNINNTASTPLTLNNSSSGRAFTLKTAGSLVMGNVSSNASVDSTLGDVTISSTSGSISINSNANITAKGGNLSFVAAASGSITVGSGVQMLSSSTVPTIGTVRFITGIARTNTKGTKPANVVVNETLGGQVFFGTNGIVASAPDNTLNAKGRNIIFSANQAGAISLGGGVTITADPPEGSAAEAALIAAMAQHSSTSVELASAARLIPASYSPSVATASATADVVASSIYSSIPVSSNPMAISATPVSVSTLSSTSAFDTNIAPLATQSVGTFPMAISGTTNGQSSATGLDQLGDVQIFTSVPRVTHRFAELSRSNDIIEAASLSDNASTGDGTVNLTTGNIVCAPVASPAVLNTKFGALTIAPNSLVLAMATEAGLAVFNLDDRSKNAVTLKHDHQTISVAPGQHLFITDQSNVEFADINVHDRILYSDLQKTRLNSGHHLFNAQFFIPSVIESVKPLMVLVSSKDSVSTARTKRLMKTAAVLMHLKGGVSSYQAHSRRSITAFAR